MTINRSLSVRVLTTRWHVWSLSLDVFYAFFLFLPYSRSRRCMASQSSHHIWHILIDLVFFGIYLNFLHILKFLNIYWSEEKIVYCAFHGQFGQHFLLRQVDPEIPGKWVGLRKMGAGHSTEKVQKVPKWADIPLVLRNWEVRTDATRAGATGQHQQYSLHLLLERSRNVVIRRRLKF